MFPLLFVLHPHQHGWRWAIYHVSERDMLANPRAGCVNAGFQLSRHEADDIGQQCLYTLLSFGSKLGHKLPVKAFTYDFDLTPPDVPLTAYQGANNFVQMGV